MNIVQDFVYHRDEEGNLVSSGFCKKDLFSDLGVPAGLYVEREYYDIDKEDEMEDFSLEDNPVIDAGLFDRLVALVQIETSMRIPLSRKKRRQGVGAEKTKRRRLSHFR